MRFLLLGLVGLLVSVQASPVSPPTVTGQVRLAVGSPVAGAQVALFDLADLRRWPVGQATTDENGQFALPRPVAGRYGLVVSGAGLVAYVDSDFDVAAGLGSVVLDRAGPKGAGKRVPPLAGMLGDVNADGQVDLADGLLVAMSRVDPALSLPRHGSLALGDVNCNGRVEFADAGLIGTFVAHPSDASVSALRIGQRGGYSLDPVMEVIWGSILGNEHQDATVAQLLDAVPVLMSGVLPNDGQKQIYLGIDRAWWAQHGGKHLYEALKERFPVTPIHVGPSAGVNRQSGVPGPPNTAIRTVKPVALFGEPISISQTVGTAIVDNDKTQTVVGRIAVPDDVWVGTVSVGVEIIHPSRRDLKIDLVAPSGVFTTLYDGAQAGAYGEANLIDVLPTTTALQGQAAQGEWQLRVGDYERADAGRIQAWELTITPAQDAPETEEPVNLFLETFQEGLGAWEAPKWEAVSFDGVAGEGPGNIVAQAPAKCGFCFLTLKSPVDLSAYETVTLSFSRYLSHDLSNAGFFGLAVGIGIDGTYERLENWGGRDADSEWHQETFTLSGDQISDTFSIRFLGVTTTDFSTVAIDNVIITAGPGSIVVTPEPTETTVDLAVASVTARPETTGPGGRVLLRTTIKNTDVPTGQYNVTFFRHTRATDAPQVGGVPIATRTRSLETNKDHTSFISTTAPTTPATYHYYVCVQELPDEDTSNNCASATVTVQEEDSPEPETPDEPENVAPEPDPEPEQGEAAFAITNATITPLRVYSGDNVTITATVTNTGTATGNTTISIYRAIEPFPGKRTQEPNTTTVTIAPSESATITSTHEAPTITQQSYLEFEVCADDSCQKLPGVTVLMKDSEYTGCERERRTPMGGDSLYVDKHNNIFRDCAGTITLGGVEDTDGVRGLIASGHGIAFHDIESGSGPDYSQTGMRTSHGRTFDWQPVYILGTVFKMPTFSIDDYGNRTILADAAFIAYPKDRETLAPLKIRGENGAVYTVIGSKEPVEGESIWISAGKSGRVLKYTSTEIKFRSVRVDNNDEPFFLDGYLSIPISEDEYTIKGALLHESGVRVLKWCRLS
ncbi:MAG: hypothetical protein F4X75_18560, partial [Gemmatimonadetes bacterium]|nr:hypothetical protein [Gemmatimonadota bacterium]